MVSSITHLNSSVVSNALISGNLSVLSSKTVISLMTVHHKICLVLYHQNIKVYKCLGVWIRCLISMRYYPQVNLNMNYHILGRKQTTLLGFKFKFFKQAKYQIHPPPPPKYS
jgi:hypothetical protein